MGTVHVAAAKGTWLKELIPSCLDASLPTPATPGSKLRPDAGSFSTILQGSAILIESLINLKKNYSVKIT